MNLSLLTGRKLNPAFYFLAVLYLLWISAWLLKIFLDRQFSWISSEEGAFGFWLAAKVLIWILPSIFFIRLLGKSWRDVLGWRKLPQALIWGGGIGVSIAALNILAKVFIFHRPIFSYVAVLPFVSAVLIAPMVEEITFRGAILNGFLADYRFKSANFLTAIFFLGIHFPGWYFPGNFESHFYSQQPIAIFLLGLIFGYVALKSNSIIGAMVVHSLNNLTS